MRIRLTESQIERIKSITEGNDDRYNREVKVKSYHSNVTYKGQEINDIVGDAMRLSYDIDIEARSWGIKSISLYGVTGPSDYQMEDEFYISEFDTNTETIGVKLDWSRLEINKDSSQGIVTIGDTLEINLANDSDGNIFVRSMTLDVFAP